MLPVVLWVLMALFHLLSCVFIAYQLTLPYRYPRWVQAWGLYLALMLLMFSGRVFWLLKYTQTHLNTTTDLLFDFAISLLACATAYAMWRLTRPTLSVPDVPAAYICIDAQSIVLAWNAEAERLFGYTAIEALGKDLTTLIMPDDQAQRHREALAQRLANPHTPRPVNPYLTYALDRYGNQLQVSVSIHPVKHADGTWEFHGYVRRLVSV